jgi:diadenosine tetraphosphate (Ap4A) HIT family hydrolase
VKRLAKADALAQIASERGTGCTMCALASADDAGALAANAHAVAILDRYAARPGHALVILRRHEEQLAALARDEHAALHDLGWQVARAIDRALAPKRIYVAALGSAAARSTSFPHVHLHVVPLADGGDADRPAEVFTWERGIYVFDDAAEERALVTSLRAALDR